MASINTKFTKAEKSWILYDWANSVYATNIMAAIFPIYFEAVAKGAGVNNVTMWGLGTSVATLAIAVLAPLLGAVGDFKGMKLHAALHACTTMNENQVQQTRQHDKI